MEVSMDNLELVYEISAHGQLVYCEKTPASTPLYFNGVLAGPEMSYDIRLLLFRGNELVDHRLLTHQTREVYFVLNTVALQLIAAQVQS